MSDLHARGALSMKGAGGGPLLTLCSGFTVSRMLDACSIGPIKVRSPSLQEIACLYMSKLSLFDDNTQVSTYCADSNSPFSDFTKGEYRQDRKVI